MLFHRAKKLKKFTVLQYFGFWFLWYSLSFSKSRPDRSNCVILRDEEWYETYDDAADGPDRIPCLRVVVWDGEAYALINAKATILSGHHDCRRLPRIVVRELQLAHVVAIFVWFVLQAKYHEMPNKYVPLLGCSNEIVRNLRITTLFDLLLIFKCECLEFLLQSHCAGLRHFIS